MESVIKVDKLRNKFKTAMKKRVYIETSIASFYFSVGNYINFLKDHPDLPLKILEEVGTSYVPLNCLKET